MKKKFLFAALAAATGLMTSCSNDDTLSSTDSQMANTIAFSTSQANIAKTPLSRSGETITSLSKFTVTAVNDDNSLYFDGETFNFSAGVFKSATSHYWPTTGTLSFYAISDPGTKSLDSNNIPSYTYTNWAGQKDLVAATSIAGTKQIPYPLTFQHVTSQVLIGAEAENKTEELTYKLTAVTMTTPSTGTYYFDTVSGGKGSWQIDNTKTSTYSFSDALPMSFAHNATNKLDNCYWNILPVTDGQITFRVEYQVLQNGKVISDFTGSKYKEVVVEKPNLQSGKIYTYNFILTRSTDDAITFTTTVSDWEDDDTTDETPYDPALTYVTYTDGTVKTFNISGSITYDVFGTKSTVQSIQLGNKVKTIADRVFSQYTNLEHVYLPSSVTTLGTAAFCYCTSLKSLDIPASINNLPDHLFQGCKDLEHVTLTDNLTSIGNGTFNACYARKELVLPNTLKSIGDDAIAYCTSMETINIPRDLETIGAKCFKGDESLKTITVDKDNTHFSVEDNILYNYDKSSVLVLPTSRTGHLSFPTTLKTIPECFAEGCHITSLTIPDGVDIGERAFSGADRLESITIGADCKLGTNAFRQNIVGSPVTTLQSVRFNGKVTFNGFAVFWGCVKLSTITYNSLEAPEFNTSVVTSSYNGWSSTTATNAIGYNTREAGTNMFYVPAGATYTESDLDKMMAVLFDTSYSGFTLSKTL